MLTVQKKLTDKEYLKLLKLSWTASIAEKCNKCIKIGL